MAGVKEQVIQMISSLSDESSVDDIMAELYFKLQVDAGLKELDESKGILHEEVEKRWQNGSENELAGRLQRMRNKKSVSSH